MYASKGGKRELYGLNGLQVKGYGDVWLYVVDFTGPVRWGSWNAMRMVFLEEDDCVVESRVELVR